MNNPEFVKVLTLKISSSRTPGFQNLPSFSFLDWIIWFLWFHVCMRDNSCSIVFIINPFSLRNSPYKKKKKRISYKKLKNTLISFILTILIYFLKSYWILRGRLMNNESDGKIDTVQQQILTNRWKLLKTRNKLQLVLLVLQLSK